MQRVNLGKPYEDYIKRMVKGGYYASASEVLRDALREKMKQEQPIPAPKKTLQQLVQEGLDSVEAGRTVPYTKGLLKKALEQAKINAKAGKKIPSHILP